MAYLLLTCTTGLWDSIAHASLKTFNRLVTRSSCIKKSQGTPVEAQKVGELPIEHAA